MIDSYLLVYDIGTSSLKATLYSTTGRVIGSVSGSYETQMEGNCAEQDPDDWWNAVREATYKLRNVHNLSDVIAISLSGHMSGCVCVDRHGKALRPSLIWADQRATREVEILKNKIGSTKFYQTTGHRLSPMYMLPKLMWIKKNEPEIYCNTYKVLNTKDYVILKMTGQFVTDYSDASGTGCLDLSNLQWSDSLLQAADVSREMLPQLMNSTTIVGSLRKDIAEDLQLPVHIPVVCGGGDGPCAALGSGCVVEESSHICVGTSAWIAVTRKAPIYDRAQRIFTFAHVIPNAYLPCGTMQSAGASYSWLKSLLSNEEPEHLRGNSVYESVGRLIFLPLLLGERSPNWKENASAAFIGLRMEHGKSDLIRAVMEGVSYNLRSILDVFREYQTIPSLRLIGGAANIDSWSEMIANVLNVDLLKMSHVTEATSIGAAILCGVGVGVFSNVKIASQFIETESVIKPTPSVVMSYETTYHVYEEAYAAIANIFDSRILQ